MSKFFTRAGHALLFLTLLIPSVARAQQSNLTCSQTNVPLVNSSTPVFNVTRTRTITGSGVWANSSNIIDNDLTNFATGGFVVTPGTVTISVTDAVNDYNAGDFAGYVVKSTAISLNVLGSLSIKTYLNGVLQETKSAGGLLGVGSSLISGAYEVGFYTNMPFDQVELTATSTIGLAGYDVYYAILRGTGSCATPALSCNVSTSPVFPSSPAVIDPERTGATGAITLAAITNTENAVDNDPASYATISTVASVAGTAAIAVKNVVSDYAAGTYAGFDIENTALASVGLLSNITISTYRDGLFVEQQSGSGLLLGASVLGRGGRQKAGFVTTQAFDEVQLVINQTGIGIDLGATRIYGAVIKKLCAGPALTCNTPTMLDEAIYPVYTDMGMTGTSGALCAACRVDSTGNVIDGDANTGATINLTAGVLAGGSIAVKDGVSTYDSATFAGFDIENTALLDVNVLSNITVTTYLAGVQQEAFFGNTLLVGASTNLLGTSGRMTVGNVARKAFDEVRLSAVQTVGVNLGITKVYGVVLTKFCGGTIGCNSTYWLTNPTYPVFIDGRHTGVTGAVCAACNVTNAGNVLSASTADFAQLKTVAGIASSSSIAVHDAVSTYPAGTIAGFAFSDPNSFLQVNLFKTIIISTYNNGVLQETKGAGQLLDLSAIILHINATTGYYNAGFRTSLPFNEVRISAAPLVGVVPVLNVYGAFVDTRYLTGAAIGIVCSKPPVAERDHISTVFNTAVNGNLKTNDYDVQGEALTYSTTATIAPAHGAVIINPNGAFTYTPLSGFVGVDSFQYTVCNASFHCTAQWVFVSVMPARTPGGANRSPMAHTDNSQTIGGVPVSGNARSNDGDPDGNSLTYTAVTNPTHGTLVVNTNGTYTYTPDSTFVGIDSARLQVCDSGTPVLCATSLLILEVTPDPNGPVNDAPFANDDVIEVPANTNVTGNVLNNDSDPNGDALTATILDMVSPASGTLYFAPDGSYTFAPVNGFSGTVSLRYKVCDGGTPSLCDTATLTITVLPVVGPDFTPVITFDSTIFATAGAVRDFYVTISNLNGNPSLGSVTFKILKPSAFTFTYAAGTTSSAVNGTTAVQNSDWAITQNSLFITGVLKTGVIIPGNGQSRIGFSIARKPNISGDTNQNITTTIVNESGGDSNNTNNQFTVNVVAQ